MAPRHGPGESLALRRWRFGDVVFDEANLLLARGGIALEVERRPLQLLTLLLTHAGEIVTKEEILDALWPGRDVGEGSLTICMTRLRQALGELGHSAIRTVHGYGYRFAVPVTVEAVAPAERDTAATLALAPGRAVPHRPNWVLVAPLGEGGYGDAWLGEQVKSHERRVYKFARDAAGLAALRREVALGRLLREGLGPRPDLIRIIDWQFGEPPAFIEVEWAEAGNLADWAVSAGGVGALTLEVRLELAAQIAEALAAIHGMSILHKDLKPANVLIRADLSDHPAIILTDFGSGHLLDPSRLSSFGITAPEAAGTLADSSGSTQMYRAPELAAGGAPTVQADIFALGVMLFQLAAGDLRRPFAPGWEALIPDPLLRDDIACAAAGDPDRRLADAAELAARLRALPGRRAALARAEARAKEAARLRRAMERANARRGPIAALIGALCLGLAASTSLYLRAERSAARAEAVTSFLTDDVLLAANPLLAADPTITVKALLGGAAASLARRFPERSLDRAAIEATIGAVYAALADTGHALPLLQAALDQRRRALGDSDPRTLAVRLTMAQLAERVLDTGRERAAGEAILAAKPADPATELAARYYILVAGCGINGDPTLCVQHLRPFLAETRERLGPRHPFAIRVQSELAYRLGDAQKAAEAIPMARDAVALSSAVYGADHVLVQERRFRLASILVQADQPAEALDILKDVRRRLLDMAGTETLLSARVANQMGIAYQNSKRYAEAIAAYQTALDAATRAQGESGELAVSALNNLGVCYFRMGDMAKSITAARRTIELRLQIFGPDTMETLWARNNLARALDASGDLDGAEAIYRDIVARGRRVLTHGEWELGQFEFRLGELLAKRGRTAEARGILVESAAILTKSLGSRDARTSRTKILLASLRPE